jgi:hypothetical protein
MRERFMKVGDLVKIYNYTHKARAEAREKNRSEAQLKDINAAGSTIYESTVHIPKISDI